VPQARIQAWRRVLFVIVVSADVHSQVALSVPILQAFVMFIEDGGKVFGVLATNVFDAEIADA
jgi:hypothetical protein